MPVRPPHVPEGGGSADRALLERLRAADQRALDEILQRYWSALVKYVRSFLGATDPAEDIVQETMLRVWERRASLDPNGNIGSLLYRIARNLAVDEQRRRNVRLARRSEEAMSGPRQPPDPAAVLEESELEAAVRHAIDGLTPRRREVFTLARFHDLSYHEIAAIMELSEQTVANHMSAALSHLRHALASFLSESAVES